MLTSHIMLGAQLPSKSTGKSGVQQFGNAGVVPHFVAAPDFRPYGTYALVCSMHLYETHLPVKNTEASMKFYVDIVGLEFAYRDPARDIVFLWIGNDRESMLGLWGPTTKYGSEAHRCHFAIALALPDLLIAGKRLNGLGISTRNFAGEETTEPSVIGWMPSAQLYFQDPDGHSVEFIALLDDAPNPSFIGPLSEWQTVV